MTNLGHPVFSGRVHSPGRDLCQGTECNVGNMALCDPGPDERLYEYGFLLPTKAHQMAVPGPLPLTTDTASSKPSAPQLMTRAKTPSKQTLGTKKACQAGNRGHATHTHTAAVQSARPQSLGLRDLTHRTESSPMAWSQSYSRPRTRKNKCSSWLRWDSTHTWGQMSSLGLARRPRDTTGTS